MIRPAESGERPNREVGLTTSGRNSAARRIRVGAVQYLNTRPLVHGLAADGLDVVYDLPSRLADRLASGSLDVALIPSIELFRTRGHVVVSNACIGCRGPVMSVKLFFRTAPAAVTTLAVDEGSRTSATLARILLAERLGIAPRVSVLPIGATMADTAADAVLLIGDRALGPGPGSVGGGSVQVVWDLGDEWCRWTGLPFVFAVWTARAGVDARRIEPALEAARDAGVANLAAIAAAEAAGHGLTVPQCLGYLRDNLHYHLGAAERQALERFRVLAAGLGLVPAAIPGAAVTMAPTPQEAARGRAAVPVPSEAPDV
jgi:chorismate dehydratase